MRLVRLERLHGAPGERGGEAHVAQQLLAEADVRTRGGDHAVEQLGDVGGDDRGGTPGAQQHRVPGRTCAEHRLGLRPGHHPALGEGPVEVEEGGAAAEVDGRGHGSPETVGRGPSA